MTRFPSFGRATALTALLAFIPLLAAACDRGEADAGAPAASPGQDAPDPRPDDQAVSVAELGFDEGDAESAVVAVVEFSDFGCIHCARFHMETYGPLRDEFVETGDVVWKYVPVTIGGFPNGELAGTAGECAGEMGAFAEVRDRLFRERESWMAEDEEGAEALFVSYAEEAGLEPGGFRTCLHGEEARERLARSNRTAREIGISGTPTFIVNGYGIPGAPPLDDFRTALRELVADARGAGGA